MFCLVCISKWYVDAPLPRTFACKQPASKMTGSVISRILGNTIQLGLSLSNAFSGPNRGHLRLQDAQALTSLLAFLMGTMIARLGDITKTPVKGINFGSAKSRGWLAVSTCLQALLTTGAAICAIYAYEAPGGMHGDRRAEPSWTNVAGFATLAFCSASMGVQALAGTRLGSHFAT